MFNLRNHPFEVEAFFRYSLVLTFAVPLEKMKIDLPECLEPDSFHDQWAFVAVAMVQTKDLRPRGFPRFLGNDFLLVGFRVFVKYTSLSGKHLRGLYILKSETDKRSMNFLGNLMTHYKYSLTDIKSKRSGNIIEMKSAGLLVNTDLSPDASLPHSSPFQSWTEARRFAGPLPFTFSYNEKKKEVLIIEGVREHWAPRAVTVNEYKIEYLDRLNMEGMVLASAFVVEEIPYYWKKGKTEIWRP